MAPLNLKDKFRNGELDLSSCGLKEIPKDIVRIHFFSFQLFPKVYRYFAGHFSRFPQNYFNLLISDYVA